MFHEGLGTGVVGEGNVDGMECDEQGNLWVTGTDGVWVSILAGEHIGVIETPEGGGA